METTEQEEKAKEYEKKKNSMRLSREEIKSRVRDVREKLELYREQIEALPFNICDEQPMCLGSYGVEQREALHDLAADLHPLAQFTYSEFCYCNEPIPSYIHDDLSPMLWDFSQTAYSVGVLAGAIFAGEEKKNIDRLERGLVFSLWLDVGARRDESEGPATDPEIAVDND